MRIPQTRSIFIAFALSMVVKANFLAAAARGIEPIILSVGSVLAAVSLEAIETQPTEGIYFWKSYTGWPECFKKILPWGKKKEVEKEKTYTKEEEAVEWKKAQHQAKGIMAEVDKILGEDSKKNAKTKAKFESSIESMRGFGIQESSMV